MDRYDLKRRTLYPMAVVFGVIVVSFCGYFGSRHMTHPLLHQAMAGVFGTTYFLSVAFGPLYIFTTGTVLGASLAERISASFVCPFLWMTKEVFRLTESHPLSECLYWYVNPLHIWLVCLVFMEMGIATLMARSILKRRGEEVKGSVAGPLAVTLGSLFLVVSLYAWGKGENIYVLFLEGYRLFFGSLV